MSAYNAELHTGQVVLFAAQGILGRIIAAFTAKLRALWSKVYSHGGTLVAEKWIKHWWDMGVANVREQHVRLINNAPDPERWWVFEAIGSGLWFTPLDEHLDAGADIMVREAPLDLPAPEGWKDALASFCARVSGSWRYNYRMLLANGLYEILGAPASDPSWLDNLSDEQLIRLVVRFMCTQSCSFLLRRFRRVDPCPRLADRATAPDDLAAGPPKCVLVTVCKHLERTA